MTTLIFGFAKYLLRYSAKVTKLAEFCRKKCIPVEQLFKADSPQLAEQSPLKKLQEDISFVPELLLDPEKLLILWKNFRKNFESLSVHLFELLSVKQFTETSWWVLSSLE